MHFHITREIAILMLVSLIIGGVLGGAAGATLGFIAGVEGGEGRDSFMTRDMQYSFDDHMDGETNDDQGAMPNGDEKTSVPQKHFSPEVQGATSTRTQ